MMSDADALEHEIEASRGRLGRTLDSLTQRLTPTGIVEDMLGSIRHDATGAVLYDGALEAVRRNPVPVLMMCLGTVMLLKGKGPIGGAAYRAIRDPDRFAVPSTAIASKPPATTSKNSP